jgi:ribonuclease E
MTKKILIDAAHPEETRVAVVQDNRVEEFDFESSTKARIRGNIYLAKVTRVEPSLQAAFIDYGGNRHGFLAFNEIHPDYYQIPTADRAALLEAEAAAERAIDFEIARQIDQTKIEAQLLVNLPALISWPAWIAESAFS